MLLLMQDTGLPLEAPTRWAGHIVVQGERHIPLLGDLDPRTDTFVLAEVRPVEGGFEVEQRNCRTVVAPVAGAQVRFLPGVDALLPLARIRFEVAGDGLVAQGWETGWGEEDVDLDGNPGVTVEVDAPMCGGHVYVASHTRSAASAGQDGEGLRGSLQVTVEQRILGADGACLRLVAQDSLDPMTGVFVYAPVAADATCEALLGAWPVKAD